MSKLNQSLLLKTFFILPLLWLGITIPTTCITCWHGGSIYFIYLLLLTNLIGALSVMKNYKSFYLLAYALFIISTAFNLFGMLLLFFPALNTNTLIFFSLSPIASLIMSILFFSIFVFFALMKAFTIDYDAMKKEAYKNGTINRLDGLIILTNSQNYIAKISFKNIFSSKLNYWVTTFMITTILLVLGPFRVLGSTMERNGNTPFNAIFFLLGGFVITWCCYIIAISCYAQYQLIKKIEQDLHLTLKPVFKTT